MSRKLTLALAGCLFVQFSGLAQAQVTNTQGAKNNGNLIDQLDPNDPCAWWNTTSPSNCTGSPTSSTNSNPLISDTGSSNNPDPWNWGSSGGSSSDPTWNYNGPDNGAWGGVDPGTNGMSGGWGGGMYSPPQMGFLEKQMYSVLSANYTAAVVQDMNGHGLWDTDAQDAVADEIIKKYSMYSAAWGATASAGIYLLDYIFLDKWRMSGSWGYAGSIGMMGAGTGGILLGESFKVMQAQMAMLLELMELYGELPTDISQRANQLSIAMDWSLGGSAAGTFVNRALALETVALPGAGAGAGGAAGTLPAAGLVAGETLLGQSGVATAANGEKAAVEVVAKSGLLKAAIERFGATKVGAFMAAHSTFFKVGFATAFAAGSSYLITYGMGQYYKKTFRKIAQIHEHNVIESFKNDSNAKQAVWLILTKYVFKPDATDDALTPKEAKLYAAIVSQQIPLLHYGTHNEPDSLFKQYRGSSTTPTTLETVKKPTAPGTSDIDFGLGTTPPKTATPAPNNEIDKKLEVLNMDLDLQQKLYLIKLVEGGMLMKGFLSPRDTDTLMTISIELGLSPVPKHPLKDNDPRMLMHTRYKIVRDGMVGEVRKKVLAFEPPQSREEDISIKDLRNRSGELIMEDFYKPEQVALRAWTDRINFQGQINEKDYAKFESIAPILEGEKKLAPITKLPDNLTADGSPRANVK